MKSECFINKIRQIGIQSLIGVPDSTLKQLCDYINSGECNDLNHYVPANEGAAVAMAVGTYLSTGKPACVYMQNSGIGNIVNPITSIANSEVYDIPMLFVTGWRGEPGIKDEPQHKFMGKITREIYELLDINYSVIDETTTPIELDNIFEDVNECLKDNKQYALIIKKNTFEKKLYGVYENKYDIVREDAIASIIENIEKDAAVISTTGKISREVYEQSDIINGNHKQDFLTVGGMGHASMIALGYALNRDDKRVYCIDGDGAVFMHMGSLAFITQQNPNNFVHICINNCAHESVGGMPTGVAGRHFSSIAKAAGYKKVYHIEKKDDLINAFEQIKKEQTLTFVEIMVSIKSRENLGRPKESAIQNKKNFMEYHGIK